LQKSLSIQQTNKWGQVLRIKILLFCYNSKQSSL